MFLGRAIAKNLVVFDTIKYANFFTNRQNSQMAANLIAGKINGICNACNHLITGG